MSNREFNFEFDPDKVYIPTSVLRASVPDPYEKESYDHTCLPKAIQPEEMRQTKARTIRRIRKELEL